MEWAGLLALVKELGPIVAVMGALVFAMARDLLVTRGQVERLLAVKDEMRQLERARGDEWKSALEAERAARITSDEQVGELLEVVEVHTTILRAIQDHVVGKRAS
jgi:hypothetical protein